MPNQFEKEFGEISFSYLQVNSPEILEYVLGFHTIDYDEKESKGLGFFLININKRYFYIPVIFLNGELKDLILMYDKKADMMYPTTEGWINHFVSKAVTPMGVGSDELPEMSNAPFNFRDMASPETMGKWSSEKETSSQAKKAFFEMVKSSALIESSEKKGILATYLKEANLQTKRAFLEIVKSSVPIRDYFVKTYKDGLANIIKAASTLDSPKIIKQGRLKIIDTMAEATDLDVMGKLLFTKNGYVVEDERAGILDTPVEMQYRDQMQRPDSDGIYRVVTSTHGVIDALCCFSPAVIGEDRRLHTVMIIDTDTKEYGVFDKLDVTFLDYKDDKDLSKSGVFTQITKMVRNGSYTLFDHISKRKTGNFTAPFRVDNKVTDKEGNTFFKIYPSYCLGLDSYLGEASPHDRNENPYIHLRDREAFSVLNDTTYAPKSAMVVRLGRQTLKCPTVDMTEANIFQKYDKYKISGTTIYKNDKAVGSHGNEKKAVLNLAKQANITVHAAGHYVKSQAPFFIKKAMGPFVSNNADYSLNNLPPQRIQEREVMIQEAPGSGIPKGPIQYPRFPGEAGPFPAQDSNLADIKSEIEQLANLSSRTKAPLFEEGFIGLLTKIQNPGDIIKKYIPDMTKTLDRLGKVLLTYWFHGYKVKEDFGLEEFTEFESLIRDTFESLGEIILKLHSAEFKRDL
jgi:hypothetical protein